METDEFDLEETFEDGLKCRKCKEPIPDGGGWWVMGINGYRTYCEVCFGD